MFTGTKIGLQKWFLAITMMANAKKSLSSCQLLRDLGLKQKAAWCLMMCIRAEMGKDNLLGQGPVEADETHIGGSSRKDYDKEACEPCPRGHGTAKDGVIGAIARGGKVVAELVSYIAGETIAAFNKRVVNTDQFRRCNTFGKEMEHETINRSEQWETDGIRTNTMDGFWSFVKRAWYGSHHHISTDYTPLYLAEACYKDNYRGTNIFAKFLTESMGSG